MKVFVVTHVEVVDGDDNVIVKVFADENVAKNELNSTIKSTIDAWADDPRFSDCMVKEESENYFCIYEDGYYCQNHDICKIDEIEVR